MPSTIPQPWENLSRALEQAGSDQFEIAMLKKNLDLKGGDHLHVVSLDASQLRVIGFTDV
jgi:hypothetical protein